MIVLPSVAVRVEFGDVQPFGESGDFPGAAVRADFRENFDRVAGRPVGRGRKGVLARLRDPEPALDVEGEVHRFADLRLGRHQLNFKSGRQMETLPLGLRRARLGGANKFGKGIGGRETPSNQNRRRQNEPTGRMAK